MIFEAYLNGRLSEMDERGFPTSTILKRQVNIGNYGVIDLLGIDLFGPKAFEYTIYELKKGQIDVNAFLQILGYYTGLKEKLHEQARATGFGYHVRMVLIGSSIQKNGNFCYLADFHEDLNVYTYEFDFLDGLKFELLYGFNLIDPGSFCLGNLTFNDKRRLLNG